MKKDELIKQLKEGYVKYLMPFIEEGEGEIIIGAFVDEKCPLVMLDHICRELGAEYCVDEHKLVLLRIFLPAKKNIGMTIGKNK